MEELLSSYPHLQSSSSSLSIIIPSLLHLIGDDESLVRSNLLSFLGWLLPRASASSIDSRSTQEHGSRGGRTEQANRMRELSSNALSPYLNQLFLYTTSAMSHIFMQVRVDAVKILEVLMQNTGAAGKAEIARGWARVRPSATDAALHVLGDGHTPLATSSSGLQIGDDAGHAGRILQCLLNLLGVSTTPVSGQAQASGAQSAATSTLDLSPNSRLLVINALSNFLDIVTADAGSNASPDGRTDTQELAPSDWADSCTWIFASSFTSPSDFEAFENLLKPAAQRGSSTAAYAFLSDANDLEIGPQLDEGLSNSLMNVSSGLGTFLDSAGLQALISQAGQMGSLASADSLDRSQGARDTVSALWITLAPFLISTFVECVPDANAQMQQASLIPPGGSPLSLNAAAETICHIFSISLQLFRSSGLDDASASVPEAYSRLATLLAHTANHFPFGEVDDMSAGFTMQAHQRLRRLNLAYCELCARISDHAASSRARKGNQSVACLDHVQSYIHRLLHSSDVGSPASLRLTAETWVSILPTLWLLLNRESSNTSSGTSLINQSVDHFLQAPASEPATAVLLVFLARLCVLPSFSSYQAAFSASPGSAQAIALRRFFSGLPKYLWETSIRQDPISETVVALLRHLSLDERLEVFTDQDFLELQDRLVPFFVVRAGGVKVASRLGLDGLIEALQPLRPELRKVVHDVA